MKFQDLWNKFSFLFRQLCDKKTCAFVVMGIGNKVVWAGGGMGRIHRTHSVLLVYVCACVCVCVCSKIFVTLIFHDHLHCCEIFLSRFLISFVFKQPLHLVFNKAATIVLNRISSFHVV